MDKQARSPQGVLHVFIGRDAELNELSAGVDDAIAGHGRLFLISGEPGAGKTTLAEKLAARGSERGMRVLWGRCWEDGGAPAFWPWVQVLRPLVERRSRPESDGSGTGPVDIAMILPEFADRTDTKANQPPQSDAARFRLFANVSALLKSESSRQPLLVVIDDLHAADPASLLLLRFVVRDLRGQRMLVVATYRDLEAQRDAEVTETIGELVREGPSIRLSGFGDAEVRQFVSGLTGASPPDEAVMRVREATGGNPLFIREMVRLVGPDGRPGWRGHPAISAGVRAVIHQRLSSLDANAVEVLSVAAVVGHDFDVQLVGKVSTLDLPDIVQGLAQAERADLLVRVSGSSTAFRFSHGLVREVLHDDLPAAARRELHAKVAAAIERLHGAGPHPHLAQVAYHYAEAASPDVAPRAMEYARRAGDQAMESQAYEEAAVQYGRALEALRLTEPDEAHRCELLLRLGTAQARAGDYQEAKSAFAQAAGIARALRAPEQLARAALGYGEPQVEGGLVDQQLLALLREALDRLSAADSALRARVLARLSLELTFSDDRELREGLRESLSREALDMARRLGDVTTLAIACRARWMAIWGPDGLEERSALADEMLGLATEAGDRELELIGRARRIACSLEAGDLRAVEADVAAHARLAGEIRMPYHEWTALTIRAGRALLDGSLDLADRLAGEAQSILAGRPNARLAYLNQVTPIAWERGRLGDLRDAWQGIVERFPQAGFGRAWLALADAELGRDADARRHLRTMAGEVLELPRSGLWLPALATASLATAHLDDPESAAVIYPLLLPYAGRTIAIPMPHPVMCFGASSLYLALLASTMSRWDEAAELFESAIRANRHLGARAFLARTQYEYARMLLRRGQAADRERAVALLAEAEDSARSLGLAVLAREIEALRSPSSRASAPFSATTARPGAAGETPGTAGENVFRQEGDYRTIVYEGSLIHLRDSKGLRLLARMLAAPGQEFHAIDLESEGSLGAQSAPTPGRQSTLAELESRPDLGDAGEMLDAEARASYRARLREIDEEIEEADEWADPERASRAREERDFLVAELSRAVGLGGRGRRAGSHAERARINVTRAIKAALDNIDRHHPSLGKHLRSTIRTGTYCSYNPDPRVPVNWQF